jgi:hypothetical protein
MPILFFATLTLLGVFLAKGVNPPFGEAYIFFFEKVPGFQLFRDPTKFYVFIALGFSMLIPYALGELFSKLSKRKKYGITSGKTFIVVIVIYFVALLWPGISGKLNGTLQTAIIPADYQRLERFLAIQPEFFRTLWVPSMQRFGYYSNSHPAMHGLISNKTTMESLQERSIKYVIVPIDTDSTIFVTDRKYSNDKYEKTVSSLRKVSYLEEVPGFEKLKVFQIPSPKAHFWSVKDGLVKSIHYNNPTSYTLNIKNAQIGDSIVFSENFDKYWNARIMSSNREESIQSRMYNKIFNSFVLNKSGSYSIEVYYSKQKYVQIGGIISVISLIGFIITAIYLARKKHD